MVLVVEPIHYRGKEFMLKLPPTVLLGPMVQEVILMLPEDPMVAEVILALKTEVVQVAQVFTEMVVRIAVAIVMEAMYFLTVVKLM